MIRTFASCSVGYFIRAGVLNLRKLGSVERNILQTIEHPDYSAPQVYYDVAIIVLDEVQWQHSVDTKKLIVFAVKGFRIQWRYPAHLFAWRVLPLLRLHEPLCSHHPGLGPGRGRGGWGAAHPDRPHHQEECDLQRQVQESRCNAYFLLLPKPDHSLHVLCGWKLENRHRDVLWRQRWT